jgi:hypothetical protein
VAQIDVAQVDGLVGRGRVDGDRDAGGGQDLTQPGRVLEDPAVAGRLDQVDAGQRAHASLE